MARLSWDNYGQRFFEVGVDRAVLYVDPENGVPWSGIVSISENPSGGEVQAYYAEGIKYLSLTSVEEFNATLEAYTYPDEFAECDGLEEVQGLFIGQQKRSTFGLCYRTKVGNDVDGDAHAYKIHVIYNALASPSEKAYGTISDSPESTTFTWDISTTPAFIPGYRPTAHFTLDSRKVSPEVLSLVENVLYGSPTSTSRLPSPTELIALCDVPYVDPQFTGAPIDGGFPDSSFTLSYDGESPSSVATLTLEGGHA